MVDLKKVLKECNKTAKIGYKIASTKEKDLNKALTVAKEKIQSTLLEFNSSSCYSPEATDLLERQLSDIEQSFIRLSFAFKEDLENLHSNMSKFSITLFGRTMAGKSTLMEILTEGDGNTIGKGAQRTTRDVRKYSWNGLEITDVPGIGAFEGEDDEQIAFEAAKTADLILFLLTDDAPQAAEADCFNKIINMGKPVICIVNVKSSVSEGKSIKLIERDVQKKFDLQRLQIIQNQFLKYAEQYGQSWDHIPFTFVHLKSAFLAQQMNDDELSAIYYKLSKIDYLKEKIIEEVENKGKFLRIKTFIDIISNPILESIENLLSQSQVNTSQDDTIINKKKQLEYWKKQFYNDGIHQISSMILKLKSGLKTEIASFAEEHFADKNADKAWQKVLKDRNVELCCQELLDSFEIKVKDKLKEISREITNELKFTSSFADDKNIRMGKIIDGKRIWTWSYIIVGGGLSISAGIAFIVGSAASGPLGWAALAATGIGMLVSKLFKSREKKEREARTRLENNLKEYVDKMCSSLQKQMENNLNTLISVRVNGLLKDMNNIHTVIRRLASTQRELAWGLNEHLIELNNQIVAEAIKLTGEDVFQNHFEEAARIPGNSTLIALCDEFTFTQEQRDALSALMSEKIDYVYKADNKRSLISTILGKEIDGRRIRMNKKDEVVYIPIAQETPYIISRVRLAQQLTRIQIIKL